MSSKFIKFLEVLLSVAGCGEGQLQVTRSIKILRKCPDM